MELMLLRVYQGQVRLQCQAVLVASHDFNSAMPAQFRYLARMMGTSTVQIEETFARWLKRTDDGLRDRMDACDSRLAAIGAP
jgi:hypothetical protein